METRGNPNPTTSEVPGGACPPFAVALGGLAGSNAHGAGCLQALLDSKYPPLLISCTSGQLYWVACYLRALENLKEENVESEHVDGDTAEGEVNDKKRAQSGRTTIRQQFEHEQLIQKPTYNAMKAFVSGLLVVSQKMAVPLSRQMKAPFFQHMDAQYQHMTEQFKQISDKLYRSNPFMPPIDSASEREGEPNKEKENIFRFFELWANLDSDSIEKFAEEICKGIDSDFEKARNESQKSFQGTFFNILLHRLDSATASMFSFGSADKFFPPWRNICYDFLANNLTAWLKLISSTDPDVYAWKEFTNLWPGRLLQPTMFEDSEKRRAIQQDIAPTLNNPNQKIGIIFNSFDLRHGIEYVHLNKRAMKLLGVDVGDLGKRNSKGDGLCDRDRVVYEEITPETVKHALWLYLYGFDESTVARVDGAYYRQMMLSELAHGLRVASTEVSLNASACSGMEPDNPKIFVVRPIKKEWIGDYPKTHNAVRDLETKVSFSGAYAGERDRVLLINRMIREAGIQCNGGEKEKCHLCNNYKIIDIVEVEPIKEYGFYGYLFEDQDLFDRSEEDFRLRMERNGYRSSDVDDRREYIEKWFKF